MAVKSILGELASAKTQKEFAGKLSSHTTLSEAEIRSLFPRKSDREELNELIKIVHAEADDIEKKAKLVQKIGNVSGAVLSIGKKLFA